MLTVVPVLALAMSVEVTRQVRHSEALPWGLRLVQSIFLGAYALALLVSFRMTVDGLVHRDGLDRAPIVGGLVWSSLLFLVALPVWDVLQRVNPEVAEVLRRVPPWSRWRRYRRGLKKALVAVRETQAEVASSVRQAEEVLVEMRAELDQALETHAMWPELKALNEQLPPNAATEAAWLKLREEVEESGFDLLLPGAPLGVMERLYHGMDASVVDHRRLQRKVDLLVRKVEIRLRGAKVLRFDAHEKTDFVEQIKSVQTEAARQA